MNLKPGRLPRRAFLGGTASLAVLSGIGGWAQAEIARNEGEREQSVSKDIVMVHGASEGGWCFDKFRGPFEERGWTVHTPDLIGHGRDKADAKTTLAGVEPRRLSPRSHALAAILRFAAGAARSLNGRASRPATGGAGLGAGAGAGEPGAALRHPALLRQREGPRPRLHDHPLLLDDGDQSGFRPRLRLLDEQGAEG